MKSTKLCCAVGVCLCLGLAGGARAAVIDFSSWWVQADPLNLDNSGWSWDQSVDTWHLWEDFEADLGGDVIVGAAGSAPGGGRNTTTVSIIKTVTNNSGFDWTGYQIDFDGLGISYVPGSGTSDVFESVVERVNALDFSGPGTVAVGDTVMFQFHISVPAGGFSFTTTQSPLPEPSVMMFLVGGAVLGAIRSRTRT